ncbi:MAG TPA: hypothetical protein VG757_05695 [Devosia sp.]|nr:hypothetical protein [Devosia sp.]
MFDDAQQLKAELVAKMPEEFLDTYVMGGPAVHFPGEKIEYLSERFSERFDIRLSKDSVVVVGSAKLGFALHEKKKSDSTVLKAFRPYRAESDVDLTICDENMFRKIWYELTAFACAQNYVPWNPDRLADYLIYGWLRPDKFPKGKALTHCDMFYETVGMIRRDRDRGHPKISVALFYSMEQLRRYQIRSIRLSREKLGV